METGTDQGQYLGIRLGSVAAGVTWMMAQLGNRLGLTVHLDLELYLYSETQKICLWSLFPAYLHNNI